MIFRCFGLWKSPFRNKKCKSAAGFASSSGSRGLCTTMQVWSASDGSVSKSVTWSSSSVWPLHYSKHHVSQWSLIWHSTQSLLSVCVCQSVSVSMSVCEHSHGRISWSIFTKIVTDVRTPKRKNEFVRGSISHHHVPYFAPQNPHFRPKGPENPCKY